MSQKVKLNFNYFVQVTNLILKFSLKALKAFQGWGWVLGLVPASTSQQLAKAHSGNILRQEISTLYPLKLIDAAKVWGHGAKIISHHTWALLESSSIVLKCPNQEY